MICPKGSFPIIRHNEVRDITADLLTKICHDVEIEPTLQPLTGERSYMQQIQKMEQGWMLKPVGFETVHFSTLGFSTPTHKVIDQLNYPQHTPNTSRRNDEFMAKESET